MHRLRQCWLNLVPNTTTLCSRHQRSSLWEYYDKRECIRGQVRKYPYSLNVLISNGFWQTLTAFLASALSKRYTNPSSDIIAVLAGLDEVDYICSEFVTVLDSLIRNGSSCKHSNTNIPHLKHLVNYGAVDVRLKAIDTAMAMVGGAYKTGVMSYFIHRDLFPSLMKVSSMSTTLCCYFPSFSGFVNGFQVHTWFWYPHASIKALLVTWPPSQLQQIRFSKSLSATAEWLRKWNCDTKGC